MNKFFKIVLISAICFLTNNVFSQLPNEFPKELINKVFCGTTSVYGIVLGKVDYNYSTKFDYKVFISETDGIYVEYNPGQKFGRDLFGTTQKIKTLPLWKKENIEDKDRYDDIIRSGIKYFYKIDYVYSNHWIKEMTLGKYKETKDGSTSGSLSIKINVQNHQDADIYISLNGKDFCEKLKTKADLIEEGKELARIADQKKVVDQKTKNDITKLLKSKNTILDAAKKYSTLNSSDVTLFKQVNDSIEKYYGDETIEISKEKLEKIINLNKDNLTSLSNGKHKIIMNKNGELTILNQNLKLNKFNQSESKNYSNFVIPLNSQAEIEITSNTTAIQDAVIRNQTFDGCKIHKNIFGQPFRYKFLKGSWIRAYYDLSQDGYAYQKSEKNERLSKKDLVYVKKSNVNKYANSLLINTSEIDIVQKQEKLHNRLPKVIWRSTILTFSAFWISLRSIESSKIN